MQLNGDVRYSAVNNGNPGSQFTPKILQFAMMSNRLLLYLFNLALNELSELPIPVTAHTLFITNAGAWALFISQIQKPVSAPD